MNNKRGKDENGHMCPLIHGHKTLCVASNTLKPTLRGQNTLSDTVFIWALYQHYCTHLDIVALSWLSMDIFGHWCRDLSRDVLSWPEMARYLQGCLYIDRKIKERAEQGTRRFPFPPTGGLRGELLVATSTTNNPGQPKPTWLPGPTQDKATKP